jgi:hypothetical protein
MLPTLLAHGIGGVRDLPVPDWLFAWAAAVVLVLSFLLLVALWRTPQLERRESGTPLGDRVSRVALARTLRVGVQAISVGLFLLIFAAALVGTTDPTTNLAPTAVYIAFWLGVPLLSALVGDVWRVLSPWRAVADLAVWAWERRGRTAAPLASYPQRLGRWPAAVALLAFAALELAYRDPSRPRALAFAIAIYTYVTLLGYGVFGREEWHTRGEGFAVAFAYFARIAPLTVRGRSLRLRWPCTGLGGREAVPGSLAVISVMLGSVAFDGVERTTRWQDLLGRIQAPYILEHPTRAELYATGTAFAGLLLVVIAVAGAYAAACAIARRSVPGSGSLVPEFLLSLVPIAFVYEVAHYFSLVLTQGQFLAPLLSDPFGRGWDILGTAAIVPNLAVVSPNTGWYVQVGALVAGHVAGLAIAHDRAITVFGRRHDSLRSQYALLALMVLYTIAGLWLLSQG